MAAKISLTPKKINSIWRQDDHHLGCRLICCCPNQKYAFIARFVKAIRGKKVLLISLLSGEQTSYFDHSAFYTKLSP